MDVNGETGLKPNRYNDLKIHDITEILGRILDEEYRIDFDGYDSPRYTKINGNLWVVGDGRHRSLLYQAVGINQIRGNIRDYSGTHQV